MKSTRKWLAHELAQFAASLPLGSRVLDAGSGDQRYKQLFAGHIYESADFERVDKPYAKSTYVCDLASIPAADATYDAIVFTQVMEHLSEAALVLRELHRIAKDGCHVFYSAPLCAEEHEIPYDFYRYTQFGIRHLFTQAGFQVEEIRWLEGFAAAASCHLRQIYRGIPQSPTALSGGFHAWAVVLLSFPLKPVLHLFTRSLEKSDMNLRYTGAGNPLNYVASVRKASGPTTRVT